MKIVLAPNALKDSLSARSAAEAMARGAGRALAADRRRAGEALTKGSHPKGVGAAGHAGELVQVPVADGGDGLAEVLALALGAERRVVRVTGPRFTPVDAAFLWSPARRTAVVEMAQASGLALLDPADRDPTVTTTLGTGELMRAALDLGARHLIVGIGGSATNDGGIGMAQALGWRFPDGAGRPLPPVGGALAAIARIDGSAADPRLRQVRIEAACDVDNPLTGPRGAARIYGPQKGAGPDAVAALDAGLAHLAACMARDLDPGLGRDLTQHPGAGAAGGLGAGLLAFCGALLRPGAELVLDALDFDRHLAGADLVLTAEGRLDAQTLCGKAPAAVAARARARGVPCFGIAGSLGEGMPTVADAGFDAVFSLCPGPMTLGEARARAAPLLAQATEQAVRAFLAGRRSAHPG